MVDERGLCPRPSKACGLTTEEIAPGFTGIEVATEMPEKLRRVLANGAGRVILVDPNPVVGATIGDHARPVICDALMSLGIETRLGAKASNRSPSYRLAYVGNAT
jgi:NADH dehydrogenase